MMKTVSNHVLGIVVVAVLCQCVCAQTQDSKVVTLRQGPVRGYLEPRGGVYSYYNIPYATAPQGADRFKAPLPPPTWTNIRDGANRRIICPQLPLLALVFNATISTDCLIADVHVPNTNDTNLPVFVLVHGGGFFGGSGNLLTPTSLTRSHKIITVSFNYRLGAYGFLCLGTPFAPGNAGMKDQVALLRWVRDNIASFGGNPNDVTIGGCSAGAGSVDLLLLSKAANGLFQRAMHTGGANAADWAMQFDPIANAKLVAKHHNFHNVDDIEALEEFYKTASLERLLDLPPTVRANFYFVPCVERDVGEERFLDDAPISILKKGDYRKVPMLYGFADMEGSGELGGYQNYKTAMNKNFADVLPVDLQFESEAERQQVARRVKEFYFGNKPVGDETIIEYIKYFTDTMFTYPMLRSARLQVEAGNNQLYLYEYIFADENLLLPANINATVRGAGHCAQEELAIISDPLTLTDIRRQMTAMLQEIYFNFATTGVPVPSGSSLPAWPPTTFPRSPYMELSLTPRMRDYLLLNRVQLWDSIYDKHYLAPIPPKPTGTPTPDSATSISKNTTIFVIALLTVLLYQSY